MFSFFKNYEQLRKASLAASVVGILITVSTFMVASYWYQLPKQTDDIFEQDYQADLMVACSIMILLFQLLLLIVSRKNIPFLKSHKIKVRVQLAFDIMSACLFISVFLVNCLFLTFWRKIIKDADWNNIMPQFKKYYYALWVECTAGFILSVFVMTINFTFRFMKLQRVGKVEPLMEGQSGQI